MRFFAFHLMPWPYLPADQETIDWVAERRYTYMVLPTLAPYAVRKRSAELFREACERAGYVARHDQIGWGFGVYVAETDARAVEEFEEHFWYYARNLLRTRTIGSGRSLTPSRMPKGCHRSAPKSSPTRAITPTSKTRAHSNSR